MLLKIGVVLSLIQAGMYRLTMEYLKQMPCHKFCSTGWSENRKITPEECEERLDKIEEDVERIDKYVNNLKQNLNIMD